jgi:phosphoglucosamine mutase
MVDENAQIVDGDTILAICAADMKARGSLRGERIVGTVMSNFGFLKAMEERGIEVIKAPVGDRYVIKEMLDADAVLGGEQSGHLIFLEHNTTGDGLVSALQVLRIMIETDSRLSDLAAIVQRYPQALVNVAVVQKPPLEDVEGLHAALDRAKQQLGDSGRVLLRYSGTEPICRVMVEAPKQKMANELAEDLAQAISVEIGG